jgi:hypothetical protein
LLSRLLTTNAALVWIIAIHLTAIPFLLAGLAIDARQILGLNPWIKPLKFVLSSSIYLATVLVLLHLLGRTPVSVAIGWGVGLVIVIENVLIGFQSWRGITSHFNISTTLNGGIFGVMGVAIALNTVLLAVLLMLYCSTRPGGVGPGLLWGIRLGIFMFLLGSLQAGFMLSRFAHTVGLPDGGPRLPFLNWSTRGGDLRIGHFVGLHALQVLPLAGWLADRHASYPVLAVALAGALYAGLFVLATLQALAGKPLLP